MATEQAVLVFKVDTKDIGKAQKQLEAIGMSAIKTKSKIKEFAKDTDKGGKDVSGFGRKAGMAGVQFKQLAGQIAMGQNPMRAVGVQAADLGFVLGTPLLGAVVGISAAIASVLIPMLSNAAMNTEKLTKLNEKLAESFNIGKDGTVTLSKSLQTLIDNFGSVGELALELQKVDIAKGARDSIAALNKEFVKVMPNQSQIAIELGNQYSVLGTKISSATEKEEAYNVVLGKNAEAYGIEKEQLETLIPLIKSLEDGKEGAADSATAYVKSLVELEGKDITNKFRRFADAILQAATNQATLNKLNDAAVTGVTNQTNEIADLISKLKERADLEEGIITRTDVLTKKYDATTAALIIEQETRIKNAKTQEANDKRVEQTQIAAKKRFEARLAKLEIEGELLGGNADAAIEHDKTLTPLQKQQLQAQIDFNNELRETNAIREAQKSSMEAMLESARKALADQAAADKKAAEEKEARVKSEMQKTKDAETLAAERYLANLDFLATLDVKYAEQKKVLGQKYLDDYNEAVAQAQAQEAALKQEQIVEETAANIERLSVNEEYWALWLANAQNAMTSFNDITAAGVNAFQSGFGSAFEQVIMDGEGIKGVVSGIFEDMARAQIAALGQMAAERLTLFLMDKALGKSAAASGAAAMIANATAAQAMAGIQAYASAAAVPLTGYLAAPAALTAALTATAPLLATVATASTSATGARALGGQVRGGQSYLVGERGPEILTMPSNTMGRITPNHMMGGGQLNVTVENYGSSNISVQKISETDVRIIAREVASQTVQREAPRVIATDIANPNGRVSKTLANNTSTQRRR